jgi:uncharacterized membrane protein YcaP (DUF421 family)
MPEIAMPEGVDILLRSLALFLLIFLLIRLMGKKHPAKMSPFSFVVYSVIAVITALTALKVIENLVLGLIALAVWGLLPVALDYLAARSKTLHDMLHGKATVLIKQGKINEDNLKQVRLTAEELLQSLRLRDAFSVADVEFAVLETTGDLNVLLKSDRKPITPKQLEWQVLPQAEPQTVILDGNIINEGLTAMGLNHRWLEEELEKAGVALENVFVGQVDSSGEMYLDLFDDAVELPQPKVRELLYAGLEKAQADLTKFSLEVEGEEAKNMYADQAGKVRELLQRLRPYLLR